MHWSEPWSPEKLNGWLQNQASLKEGGEGAAGGKGKHKIARCCGLDCALRFCKPDAEARDDGYYGGGDDDDDGDDGAMATTAGSAGAVAGQHNWEYLRAEQDRFAKLITEPDRKAFVIAQVPPKKLPKGGMIAANTVVCNTAFVRFFGVSETLISSAKKTPKARASSSVHRAPIASTRDRPKLEGVVAFLHRHEDMYGQKMPNSDHSYLYLKNKLELYEEYSKSMRELYGQDPASLAERLCSPNYFNQVWSAYFSKLKLKPNGDFMLCETCTLLKEKIHGQAGSRGVQDDAERERHKSVYQEHLKDVEKDRMYGAILENRAAVAKSNGTPWETVNLQVDAANQSNFATPIGASQAHGVDDRDYAERQKIYGALVSGIMMQVFMIPQILGTGSNMVCTTLFTLFMELTLQWEHSLGDVFIQMDNTVSENKNNFIMGFLAALVGRGVMRSVTLCFMMVGHTHIQIDQVFSWYTHVSFL
ncbi:unnamed protein product [Ectocarpus sp. 12 AP-2014]